MRAEEYPVDFFMLNLDDYSDVFQGKADFPCKLEASSICLWSFAMFWLHVIEVEFVNIAMQRGRGGVYKIVLQIK